MGVLGLWEIIEQVGHPIKIEGLEGKVLGVDANIWLYKFIRGFREKDNATYSIESHKLGLFNRICKLLFYKIKPVFVFDGPAPVLKRRTLEKRQNTRHKHLAKVREQAMKAMAIQLKMQYPNADVDNLKIQLPELTSNNLVAAEKLTNDDFDLFYLPPSIRNKEQDEESGSDSKEESSQSAFEGLDEDPAFYETSKVDIHSKDFEQLPPEIRYEILHDIKATRKRIKNSDDLPEDGSSFSSFQLQRLKARRQIQEKIEKCEQDICSNYTGELSDGKFVKAYRVQSDPTSTLLYKSNGDKVKETKPTSNKTEPQECASNQNEPATTSESPGKSFRPSLKLLFDDKKTGANYIKLPGTKRSFKQVDDEHFVCRSPALSPECESISSTNSSSSCTQIDQDQELHEDAAHNESTEDSIHSTDLEEVSLEICYERLHDPKAIRKIIENTDDQREDGSKDGSKDRSVEGSEDGGEYGSSFSCSQQERLEALSQVQEEIEKCEQDACSNYTGELSDGKSVEAYQVQSHPSSTFLTKSNDDKIKDTKPTSNTTESQEYAPDQDEPATMSESPGKSCGPSLKLLSEDKKTDADYIKLPETQRSNRITTKIIDDAKELLQLFGIPYIDASGEAEAQCAMLEELSLTAGTITDDSDIWLFGAKNVYRHFFSDDKYVSQYKMNDIEFHIRMSRENLICFAMLVGSDYTDGIMNIGPVTALEIISEFQGDGMKPLIEFKEWHKKARADKTWLHKKDLKKFLKYHLPEDFPSRIVFEGYLNPTADTSTEKFTWGKPELDELREYAHRNFGWDQRKADEKLLPIMKKLNEKKLQHTIDTFFFKTQVNRNPEMFRSKRINQALNKISKQAPSGNKVAAHSSSVVDYVNLSDDED